jgi:hypothetical protein
VHSDLMAKAMVRPSRREYAEYLKEPQWEALRSVAISNGMPCQRCKMNKATQVHHLNYRNIVDVKPRDLVALCAHCHSKMHVAIRSGIKNQQSVLCNDDVWLSERIGAMRRKHVVPLHVWERINKTTPYAQKRVCGLMKMAHPHDFTEWCGLKARIAVINQLVWWSNHA